jgi:hypothetical protein
VKAVYFPAFRDLDEAWWDRCIAPEFVRHDPNLDFEVRRPGGVRKLGAMMLAGLSGIGFAGAVRVTYSLPIAAGSASPSPLG